MKITIQYDNHSETVFFDTNINNFNRLCKLYKTRKIKQVGNSIIDFSKVTVISYTD